MKVLILDNQGLLKQIFIKAFAKDNEVEFLNLVINPITLINIFMQKFPDVVILNEATAKSAFGNSLNNVLNTVHVPVVFIVEDEDNPRYGFLYRNTKKVKLIINKLNFKLTLDLFRSEALKEIKKEIKKLGENKLNTYFELKKIKAPEISSLRTGLNVATINKDQEIQTPSFSKSYKSSDINIAPKNNPDIVLQYQGLMNRHKTNRVIFVGASTGGTEALRVFLRPFKKDSPPIVIVQHMPGGFTAAFAKSLNNECEIDVKEATDGDILRSGLALVANGDYHLVVKYGNGNYFVKLLSGPTVSRHKPSVDILFRSAAMYAGKNAIGIMLTGMGDDGSRCMLEMKQNGSYNVAQDEKTCVVFGMPMEAIKVGAIDKVLPLSQIPEYLLTKVLKG